VRHSDRWDSQHRSQVQSQPGPAWVIAPGGVDEQHIKWLTHRPDCGLEKRTLAERQVATPIGSARNARHGGPGNDATVPYHGRGCPPEIPLCSGPAPPSPEAHEDAPDG
jgi:hypothetical protein